MGLQLIEPQDGKINANFKEIFNIIVRPTTSYDKIVLRDKDSKRVITETRNPPVNEDLPFTVAAWNGGTWEIVGIVSNSETDKLEVQVNVSSPFPPPSPPPSNINAQLALSVYTISQITMVTAFVLALTRVLRLIMKRVVRKLG
ncbi:hypothetical protein [Alphaspiravirus yamagawaense]|uniref:Uncharacterized protein n=1 Tax=Alphaspiravirus yamagawaense TaxID=1157339 RepID=J7QC67_9VIRU|nr:hypothetical protein [Aeropyrum coil-shaped virus]CCG27839.1 hypothetical protein [Aeropyrum coil-shaped virus]